MHWLSCGRPECLQANYDADYPDEAAKGVLTAAGLFPEYSKYRVGHPPHPV
jgi:hypothetical protein